MMNSCIRGRFAPSPSGYMHLGNAWTAILAWLQVRKSNGTMVLRIEDLDPERSRPEYSQGIIKDLKWLGLDWDEGPDVGGTHGPYLQSKRHYPYKLALQSLVKQGMIYPCFCSRADIKAATLAPHGLMKRSKYPGTCRNLSSQDRLLRFQAGLNHSLRFKLNDAQIEFNDSVCGLISENPFRESGDFIVRRSDGIFAYQLAVVVDDAAMKITDVLRGDDLIHSTPQQISLYKALGLPIPRFSHVPLLYGPDGHRLSKRHGDLSLRAFRKMGYHPRKIVGFIAYLAGLRPNLEETMPLDLIETFDLNRLPKGEKIVVNPGRLIDYLSS